MGLIGSLTDARGGLTSVRLVSQAGQRSLDRLRAMRDPRDMAHRSSLEIPADLRARLEVARLDLLALLRALDRMHLSAQEIPQRLLRQLFERDADDAEALWALDQVEGSFDPGAMLRDTLKALDQLPSASAQFRKQLPARVHATLDHLENSIRKKLNPKQAYNMV